MKKATIISRAQGALVGHLVGDALGSAVQGWTPEQIRDAYPDGVRDIAGNNEMHTLPGQPTDASEMTLLLARNLIENGEYDGGAMRAEYRKWVGSGAFGHDPELEAAIEGSGNAEYSSNSALMRVSPIGIFGAGVWSGVVELWAREDCALTHPNPVCLAANELFAAAISAAVSVPSPPEALFEHLRARVEPDPILSDIVKRARTAPPDYLERPDQVVVCLHNVLWQLSHAPSFEHALIDTVHQGGDTSTNAAVCGALLGAVFGVTAIPRKWAKTVLTCMPKTGKKGVARPRPIEYWAVDALDLAERLVSEHPLVNVDANLALQTAKRDEL